MQIIYAGVHYCDHAGSVYVVFIIPAGHIYSSGTGLAGILPWSQVRVFLGSIAGQGFFIGNIVGDGFF